MFWAYLLLISIVAIFAASWGLLFSLWDDFQSAPAAPTATPSPRYSPEAVIARIGSERRALEAACGQKIGCRSSLPIVACGPATVLYKGQGVWQCATWTFDEQTGQVFYRSYP